MIVLVFPDLGETKMNIKLIEDSMFESASFDIVHVLPPNKVFLSFLMIPCKWNHDVHLMFVFRDVRFERAALLIALTLKLWTFSSQVYHVTSCFLIYWSETINPINQQFSHFICCIVVFTSRHSPCVPSIPQPWINKNAVASSRNFSVVTGAGSPGCFTDCKTREN